jgi:hypothetical protein
MRGLDGVDAKGLRRPPGRTYVPILRIERGEAPKTLEGFLAI